MRLELYKETACPIQKRNIRKVANTAFKVLNRKNNFSISVAVVKKSTSRSINRIWRGIDHPTSVLSFAAKMFSNNQKKQTKPTSLQKTRSKREKKKEFVLPPTEKNFLGEIIIADPIIKKEAKRKGSSYQKEFSYFFLHGLLHLFGYSHRSARARKKMEDLENKIIKIVNKKSS